MWRIFEHHKLSIDQHHPHSVWLAASCYPLQSARDVNDVACCFSLQIIDIDDMQMYISKEYMCVFLVSGTKLRGTCNIA